MLTGFYLTSAYREENFPAAGLAWYLRALLRMRSGALQIGGELAKAERPAAAGSLIDIPGARELALKAAEGAWLPTTVLGVEDTLHGHLVAHDANSALAVVVTRGTGSRSPGAWGARAADCVPPESMTVTDSQGGGARDHRVCKALG